PAPRRQRTVSCACVRVGERTGPPFVRFNRCAVLGWQCTSRPVVSELVGRYVRGVPANSDAIIVRGLPPIWGAPSPSPFVIKLLTWLRMAGVEHPLRPLTSPPRSETKKVPYIELPNGDVVADSARIIARLSKERGVDIDAGLDERSRATAQLVYATLEGHL